ncbi:MAG: DUF3164 family protein [Chryseobacterium sp.]
MTTIDLSQLSAEQLEAALAEKRKKEHEDREKERKNFEIQNDQENSELIQMASEAHSLLRKIKDKSHAIMENKQERLNEYGKIRSNSKGGYRSLSSDKTTKISRRRDTAPVWDERGKKALELVHEFLYDFVKKRSQETFQMLIGFLVKNKKGELKYESVMNLLQHEHLYNDERWIEGLKLLRESYSTYFKGYQYDFEVLNEKTGKYEKIELNFSAL